MRLISVLTVAFFAMGCAEDDKNNSNDGGGYDPSSSTSIQADSSFKKSFSPWRNSHYDNDKEKFVEYNPVGFGVTDTNERLEYSAKRCHKSDYTTYTNSDHTSGLAHNEDIIDVYHMNPYFGVNWDRYSGHKVYDQDFFEYAENSASNDNEREVSFHYNRASYPRTYKLDRFFDDKPTKECKTKYDKDLKFVVTEAVGVIGMTFSLRVRLGNSMTRKQWEKKHDETVITTMFFSGSKFSPKKAEKLLKPHIAKIDIHAIMVGGKYDRDLMRLIKETKCSSTNIEACRQIVPAIIDAYEEQSKLAHETGKNLAIAGIKRKKLEDAGLLTKYQD